MSSKKEIQWNKVMMAASAIIVIGMILWIFPIKFTVITVSLLAMATYLFGTDTRRRNHVETQYLRSPRR